MDRYHRALKAGDVQAVRGATVLGADVSDLEARLANDTERALLATLFEGPVVDQWLVLQTAQGQQVRLGYRDGRWWVLDPPPPAKEGPQAALLGFLEAARQGRWSDVRRFMPARAQARFASDAALAAHMAALKPRLEAARASLVGLAQTASISGDRALIRLGPRTVELRDEDGWKILDLE